MPIELKITVDRKCIVNGKPQASDSCAIKLAIEPVFPSAKVALWDIYFFDDSGKFTTIPLPKVAVKFIADFDLASFSERLLLPEFTFTITVPDSVIDTIDIEAVKEQLVNHPNLEIV